MRSRTRPETQVLKELQTVIGMESKKGDAQVHGLLAQKLKGAGQVREAAVEYGKASILEPQNPYFLKQQGFLPLSRWEIMKKQFNACRKPFGKIHPIIMSGGPSKVATKLWGT